MNFSIQYLLSALFSILVLIACSSNREKNQAENDDNLSKTDSVLSEEKSILEKIRLSQEAKSDSGIVRIDLSKIYYFGDSLKIYNTDNSLYANFVNENLIVGNREYDLKETRKDTLEKYIDSRSFDAEYNLFIADCIGKAGDKYQVIIKDKVKLVDANSGVVKFETLTEHVLSSYPGLNESTPLRKEPNDSSAIVDNYLDFYYISVEMKGNWLKVKCDAEYSCGDCPEKPIEGWVKWRDGNKLLIDIYYLC